MEKYSITLKPRMTEGIEWTEEKRDNITHVNGRVGDTIMFNLVRFRTDNWIMTSRVVPMKMVTLDDLDECKVLADMLITKFIGELCLNMGIESPQIREER